MSVLIAFLVSLGLAFFVKSTPKGPSRVGGFVVFVAFSFALWATQGSSVFFTLRVYWLCAAILFWMGVLDDFRALRPLSKLLIQMVVTVLFLYLTPATVIPWHGLGFWLGEAVLFVWIVGITNALNLLDNMDGVCAAVAAMAGIGCWVLGVGAGFVLLPLSGALFGFLIFNFHPAKIYLGDAGSHLIGFSLATLPLYGLTVDKLWIPVFLLLIPIFDTTFVTVTRTLRGQSPFQGGNDHTTHRLAHAGVSEGWVSAGYGLLGSGLIGIAYLLL